MKPIQAYKKETLEKLKQWIADMNARGHEQYYEIFMDGVKVVHKTNDIAEFEAYRTWLDTETQLIKVLTYNTKNSHRSKSFEFRTNKFVEEVNYKEHTDELQKKNDELIKRLSDAESHILKLESELEKNENKKSGFNLQSILSGLGSMASQYPDLAGKLGGLGGAFNTPSKPPQKHEESCEATFKKKETTSDSVKTEASTHTDLMFSDNTDEKDIFVFKTDAKLAEDQAKKLYELMQFFSDKPEYIDIVHDMVVAEKLKPAA